MNQEGKIRKTEFLAIGEEPFSESVCLLSGRQLVHEQLITMGSLMTKILTRRVIV